ncbi:hypothetical protein CS0771_56560 [Catellatospora sp. IY07-71]|uniref:ATP-grasp domain-containing protein n=1 Tax=Catellatospora sp. IY07-71 TaxID=2728827 RepID=UPI001BB38151|nr:ATP-grasp domain-containing protein [Catellatospora sp. IY07-71]BCJ76112.1 hypothetical protein CS0771_56560 [Catellatospora sp. IY07-71]
MSSLVNTVAVAVVPRSAIRPADLAKAAAACGHAPVFVAAAGGLDAAEKAEYAALGPVLEVDPERPGDLLAQLRRHRPVAITTFSEGMVPTTGELAAGLGLPYHDRDTVAALTDKYVQRRRLAEHGVDTVWSAVATSRQEVLDALANRPGPLVVKPRRSQSSRDTFLVATAEDLPAEVAPSAERPFVVEEFLVGIGGEGIGDYVSVESLVVGGEPSTIGVTGKFPLLTPFREQGQFFPARLSPDVRAACARLADAAVRALGIRRGLVHTELKLTAAGPRIIEVNGRIGGYVTELYERATGLRLLELGMAETCGRPVALPEPRDTGPVHFQFGNQPPPAGGVLRAFHGTAQAAREPGLVGYAESVAPGAELAPGVMTFFLDFLRGQAADHQAMLAVLDRCLAHLHYDIEHPDGTTRRWQAGREGLQPSAGGR